MPAYNWHFYPERVDRTSVELRLKRLSLFFQEWNKQRIRKGSSKGRLEYK
jgi:hypothetical protein